MTIEAIRKKLMIYIADADNKKIKELYMLIKDDITKGKKFKLSADQIKWLEQEERKYLKGKGKSYTWDEAEQIIRSKKKV
jgi:hypothetical protein